MTHGKTIAWWTAGVTTAIFVAAGIVHKDNFVEQYWLWRLRRSDSELEKTEIVQKLGSMRSVKAIPEILRAYDRLPPITGAGYITPRIMEGELVRIGEPALPSLTTAMASDCGLSKRIIPRVIARILGNNYPAAARTVGLLADSYATDVSILQAVRDSRQVPENIRNAAVSALNVIETDDPARP